MPLRLDSDQPSRRQSSDQRWSLSLRDCFERRIPVTCVEFNPPVVESADKQGSHYWRFLEQMSADDMRIIKSLKKKYRYVKDNLDRGHFLSITDSAARQRRIHNLSIVRLFTDPVFTMRHFGQPALAFEPSRTILHLTRNHTISWTERFLRHCDRHGYSNLLIITGDPLPDMNLPTVDAESALLMSESDRGTHRIKNSIELVKWVRERDPKLYVGVAHNPFRGQSALKHYLRKLEVGAQFAVTQPVAYYTESWRFMQAFVDAIKDEPHKIPLVLGVFNYFVRSDSQGVDDEEFRTKNAFWKKLFGFVPQGVREDYDRGLDGLEILARSIQKLKQLGYFHVDVMNAERMGHRIIEKTRRIVHEGDRLNGSLRDRIVEA